MYNQQLIKWKKWITQNTWLKEDGVEREEWEQEEKEGNRNRSGGGKQIVR